MGAKGRGRGGRCCSGAAGPGEKGRVPCGDQRQAGPSPVPHAQLLRETGLSAPLGSQLLLTPLRSQSGLPSTPGRARRGSVWAPAAKNLNLRTSLEGGVPHSGRGGAGTHDAPFQRAEGGPSLQAGKCEREKQVQGERCGAPRSPSGAMETQLGRPPRTQTQACSHPTARAGPRQGQLCGHHGTAAVALWRPTGHRSLVQSPHMPRTACGA